MQLASRHVRCQIWIQYTVMQGAGICEAPYVAHVRLFNNDVRTVDPDTVEWIGLIVVEKGSP